VSNQAIQTQKAGPTGSEIPKYGYRDMAVSPDIPAGEQCERIRNESFAGKLHLNKLKGDCIAEESGGFTCKPLCRSR